ncbi:Clp protease N-terminal domain-containing protein [Streptomyces sp. NPDC004732]
MLAQEAARTQKHDSIGTEHLLRSLGFTSAELYETVTTAITERLTADDEQ